MRFQCLILHVSYLRGSGFTGWCRVSGPNLLVFRMITLPSLAIWCFTVMMPRVDHVLEHCLEGLVNLGRHPCKRMKLTPQLACHPGFSLHVASDLSTKATLCLPLRNQRAHGIALNNVLNRIICKGVVCPPDSCFLSQG